MFDNIKQNIGQVPSTKIETKKPDKEQVSESLGHFWKPIVDFFSENETEKLMRTEGLDAAINFYEFKAQEMKDMFPQSPDGQKINILG